MLFFGERHLEELERLTNQEFARSTGLAKERVVLLESQLNDMDGRLGRPYEALETGKLELDDLAPRIRELREKGDC
jgi:hypothetical protein